MSWELASFLVLGAVLIGGFAWYERSRPPAQVVALVAALAALAIAGRIAFAAFPNVKPTTDIVVFAGYALGGAPGFAVGALAALVSNFWFGQGPWTPWQMVGWGFCGLLGAALALGTRNAGRFTLAAVCGLAGVLYGALLNFSLMATYGGDLSWERFWLLETRAIPFDAAHVLGNVAFALIAGPALVRMLVRFRERFEWGRGRVRISTAVVALLLLAALAPAQAGAATRVERAAEWLVAQQNADGGFGASPESDSGPEMTAWAMLGLAAAGRNPLDVARAGRTPVSFLRGHVDELKTPGDLARTILALEAAGVDPRDLGGVNLVKRLLAKRRGDGSYYGWPNSTAFAVIALRAAGATGGLKKTLTWLRATQNEDGGWGDTPKSASTADGTGAVLQAISPGTKATRSALGYLTKAQRKGGGFPLGGNGAVNTQSTAWAAQGIVAAGKKPSEFRRGGSSALDYLADHQQKDGHYRYSGASDQTPVWVTSQVLVAVAGHSYPVAAPARTPKPKPSPTSPATTSPATPAPPPAPQPGSITPAPAEPLPASPGESGGGGGGSRSEPGVPPGQSTPGPGGEPAPPATPGTEGAAEPEAQAVAGAEEPGGEGSSSSVLGSIVIGLLAGALLVAAGLAARKGWLRWRYGI
ncbi:MAG: prenyltransferase/squalene oxidase repeat-containing protein [Solirubrobacterales bacterium]